MAVIALVAALAALATVAALAAANGRARARADERVSGALERVGERMDALAHDLTGALTRVQADSATARALGELGGSLDLDEVATRIADAAAGVPGVDAAVVRVSTAQGKPLVSARGVPADEAWSQIVSGPPDGASTRAVVVTFVYRPGSEPAHALRSGLAVTLDVGGEPCGFVAVYSREARLPAEDALMARLEGLADAASPAIENGRRFREVRQLAEVDALTGLQNRRAFHDTLAREVAQAHRHGRSLSILVLDLDDFRAVNDDIGQLAGDRVLAEVADRLRDSVRGADVAGRIGGDEFAVVLPESGRIEAEGLFARVQATLRRRPPEHTPALALSGGIAELVRDDDAIALFERADDALLRAKTAGKGTAA